MPFLLELGVDCEHYHTLPRSGGLLDQPAGLMRKIRQVLNVYHAVKLYEQQGVKAGEMARWRSENQDVWQIVSDINELREQYE